MPITWKESRASAKATTMGIGSRDDHSPRARPYSARAVTPIPKRRPTRGIRRQERARCGAGQEFAPPDQGDARPLLDSEAVLQLFDQLRILCKNPLEFGPRFR